MFVLRLFSPVWDATKYTLKVGSIFDFVVIDSTDSRSNNGVVVPDLMLVRIPAFLPMIIHVLIIDFRERRVFCLGRYSVNTASLCVCVTAHNFIMYRGPAATSLKELAGHPPWPPHIFWQPVSMQHSKPPFSSSFSTIRPNLCGAIAIHKAHGARSAAKPAGLGRVDCVLASALRCAARPAARLVHTSNREGTTRAPAQTRRSG